MVDILKEVDIILAFIQNDGDAQQLRGDMIENEKQMRRLYPYVSDEKFSDQLELHAQMNECSEIYRKARESFDTLLRTKFPDFTSQDKYKTIYSNILDNTLNYEVLKNVLRQVDNWKKGHVTYAQGFNRGLDFITRKSHLPKDFFNRMDE